MKQREIWICIKQFRITLFLCNSSDDDGAIRIITETKIFDIGNIVSVKKDNFFSKFYFDRNGVECYNVINGHIFCKHFRKFA